MRRSALFAIIAAALLPAPALAQTKVLYANNFDTENGGKSAYGINAISGFVTPDYPFDPPATVDLVHTGDTPGFKCAGGSGGCLNLEGASLGAGVLLSIADYAFKPGDIFTFSYSIGGSQTASSPGDGYTFGINFNEPTDVTFHYFTTTGVDQRDTYYATPGLSLYKDGIPFNSPFANATVVFQTLTAGSFFLSIDGTAYTDEDYGGDGHGAILDNLLLTVSPAPEPATWAMMIAGFGLVGTALRRRPGRAMRVARAG